MVPLKIRSPEDTLRTILDRYASPRCVYCRIIWNTYARVTASPGSIRAFRPGFEILEAEGWEEKEEVGGVLSHAKWDEWKDGGGGDGCYDEREYAPRSVELHSENGKSLETCTALVGFNQLGIPACSQVVLIV